MRNTYSVPIQFSGSKYFQGKTLYVFLPCTFADYIVAMAASSVSCVYWEWQRDDGGFSPYVPNVSNAIEAANHAGMGGHNSGSYTVDFARMIQRKNATGILRSHYVVLTIRSTCD